jgi:hypothetical protein
MSRSFRTFATVILGFTLYNSGAFAALKCTPVFASATAAYEPEYKKALEEQRVDSDRNEQKTKGLFWKGIGTGAAAGVGIAAATGESVVAGAGWGAFVGYLGANIVGDEITTPRPVPAYQLVLDEYVSRQNLTKMSLSIDRALIDVSKPEDQYAAADGRKDVGEAALFWLRSVNRVIAATGLGPRQYEAMIDRTIAGFQEFDSAATLCANPQDLNSFNEVMLAIFPNREVK